MDEAEIMPAYQDARVATLFAGYSPLMRRRLEDLRCLIFETAAAIEAVGPIEETLKWGDPSYLTTQTSAGSIIRINAHRRSETCYAAYFHCQTNLVETFRVTFGEALTFEGNRAILFNVADEIPKDLLALCFRAALSYRLSKRSINTRNLCG